MAGATVPSMLPSTTAPADPTPLAVIGALLPAAPTEGQIVNFAALVQAAERIEGGQIDINTMHHRAEGVYGRSVTIPAGGVLVGLSHLKGCLVVCVGDITVWSAGQRRRITGATIFKSDPGGMRVGLAHADTTWLTVHATDATDIASIEGELVEGADRLITRREVTA